MAGLAPTVDLSVTCPQCGPFHLSVPLHTWNQTARVVTVQVDTEAVRLALNVHLRQHAPDG